MQNIRTVSYTHLDVYKRQSCGGAKGSKREEMKDLVTELRKKSEFIDSNIFNSVSNVNLKTIIGYKKDGEYHNFLDNYDAE